MQNEENTCLLVSNEEKKSFKDPFEMDKENYKGVIFEEPGDALCPVTSLETQLGKMPLNEHSLHIQRRLLPLWTSYGATTVHLGLMPLASVIS